jgi:hypothetical protein
VNEQIIPIDRFRALVAEQAMSVNPVCPEELAGFEDVFWHELHLAQFEQSCEGESCST